MTLLNEEVIGQLRTEFADLVNPVRLQVFSQALADPASEQVRRLVEELAGLDPKLTAESFNFVLDKEKAAALGVVRIPAIVVSGAEKDYGIRMYGPPTGYEFGTLIDTIQDVSRGDSGLSPETRTALQALDRDVNIQVFSTPT